MTGCEIKKTLKKISFFCLASLCFILPSKCVFHASIGDEEADLVLETYQEKNQDQTEYDKK